MKLEHINKVLDFMEKFEQPVNDVHTFVDISAKKLRYKLIQEELSELVEAHVYRETDYNEYIIQTADAIIDLLYVIYGCYGDFGNTIFEYDREMLTKTIFDTTQEIDLNKIELVTIKMLPNFMADVYRSIFNNNHYELSLNLTIVECVILELADLLKLDVDVLFDEVHNSNMTKLHDGKVVKNEFGKIIKSPLYTPADIKGILQKQGLINEPN